MDCLAYQRQFDARRNCLTLPNNCTCNEPVFNSTGFYSWTVEWQIFFADGKYLRVWENWSKQKGLDLARRLRFSFHYGPLVSGGADAGAEYDAKDPVEIRIDNSNGYSHMHFRSPEPHLRQERVRGLNLEGVDIIQFVEAILAHRTSGKGIDEVMGFKVV